MWPVRPRGKPTPENAKLLVKFLREVYGPYMAAHREKLRTYIFRNDKRFYRALVTFELRNELPKQLKMPTRNDLVISRLQRAAAKGFDGFTRSERRSVTGALSRLEKRNRLT
jgi:hypothetical protein